MEFFFFSIFSETRASGTQNFFCLVRWLKILFFSLSLCCCCYCTREVYVVIKKINSQGIPSISISIVGVWFYCNGKARRVYTFLLLEQCEKNLQGKKNNSLLCANQSIDKMLCCVCVYLWAQYLKFFFCSTKHNKWWMRKNLFFWLLYPSKIFRFTHVKVSW